MSRALTLISSMATRHSLAALAASYSAVAGQVVNVNSIGGVDAARRIRSGEPCDVAVLAADALNKLATEGFVERNSLRSFARSRTAVAVRPETPRPTPRPANIDQTAISRLLKEAQAVGISTGPSGTQLRALIDSLGLSAELSGRLVEAAPGIPVASLLASGKVDLGFQQLSELLGAPGITVLGTLPETMVPSTTFAIARVSSSTAPHDAEALMAYLLSNEAHPSLKQFGLDPPM